MCENNIGASADVLYFILNIKNYLETEIRLITIIIIIIIIIIINEIQIIKKGTN